MMNTSTRFAHQGYGHSRRFAPRKTGQADAHILNKVGKGAVAEIGLQHAATTRMFVGSSPTRPTLPNLDSLCIS